MATDNRGPRYGQIDRDYGRRLFTTPPDEDGPVWMVNLMHYREKADYADGRESSISGREADDLYAPIGPLTAIGAEVVFVADVERQLLGAEPKWDRIGIVKYPTRRSFIEMQSRPDFKVLHEHKDAGMSSTIVMGCQPMRDVPTGLVDPAMTWDKVEFPPNDEDPAVVVMHVMRFDEEAGGKERFVSGYQQVAAGAAGRHGGRVHGFYEVEGTILGDGRQWDQVRFIGYPSWRAFLAVIQDPERLAAQKGHREATLADTYTMVLRPRINRLEESTAAS